VAGIFNSAIFNNAIFNTGDGVPVVVTTQTGAGGRRRRRQIVLRIDGEERSVEDLRAVLAVLREAKKAVPDIARDAAAQIVLSGKRVGDARKSEQHAVQLVSAPASVRSIIEERIAEMERFYWLRVAAHVKALEDDDDEVMELL